MNHVIRVLRSNSYVTRHVLRGEESERRAERYENYIGMILRCLQCITCNTKTTDFRNKGELKEYATHFMDLMNVSYMMCTTFELRRYMNMCLILQLFYPISTSIFASITPVRHKV